MDSFVGSFVVRSVDQSVALRLFVRSFVLFMCLSSRLHGSIHLFPSDNKFKVHTDLVILLLLF